MSAGPPPPPPPLPPPLSSAGPQLQALDQSVPRRTRTASSGSERSRRTSTASSRSKCSLPDLNSKLSIRVFPAVSPPRAPNQSVPPGPQSQRITEDLPDRMPERMSEDMPDRMPE